MEGVNLLLTCKPYRHWTKINFKPCLWFNRMPTPPLSPCLVQIIPVLSGFQLRKSQPSHMHIILYNRLFIILQSLSRWLVWLSCVFFYLFFILLKCFCQTFKYKPRKVPYTLLWIVERNVNWKFMNFLRKSDTLYTAIISMRNILKKNAFIWNLKGKNYTKSLCFW